MSTDRQSRNSTISIALAFLFIAGLIGFGLSAIPYTTIKEFLDSFSGDGSADPYTSSLHSRLQRAFVAIGFSLTILAAVLQLTRMKWERLGVDFSRHTIEDSKALLREWTSCLRERKYSLSALILIGVALRLLYLNQPMRYDEAHSFLEYSSQPWFVTISKYSDPNNHVGHNLLVNLTTRIWGDSEAAIRLPAFLAGVLLIPVTYGFTRQFSSGTASGLFASAVIATSSPLIEYSTNARGYTLICLMTIVSWSFAIKICESGNRAAHIGLILSAAFGLWVVPVMLYPLAMIFLWGTLTPDSSLDQSLPRPRKFWRFVCCGIGTIALTFFLYLPIILVEGPGSLIANPYVESLSFAQFVQRLITTSPQIVAFLGRDIALPILIVASLAACWGVISRGRSTTTRASQLIALVSLSAPIALITIQRVVPPERVWLFLIPLGATILEIGYHHLFENHLSPRGRIVGWSVASVLLCLIPTAQMIRHDSVRESSQTGIVPEAWEIVQFLETHLPEETPVIAASPVSAPVKYYARQSQLDMRHFERPEDQRLNEKTAVLILSKTTTQPIEPILKSLNLDNTYAAEQFQPWKQFPTSTIYRYEQERD